MQTARKIVQSNVKLTPFQQEVDFCVLQTFDLAIVHHTDSSLLQALQASCPQVVFSLEQDILLERMIYSPYAVQLTQDSVTVLHEHIEECNRLEEKHGLLVLLDYTDLHTRHATVLASGEAYLPPLSKTTQLKQRLFEADNVVSRLAKNQIVSFGKQKKHLRYLDPHVLVHMVSMGKADYVANRFSYPSRMWIAYERDWHMVDNIHACLAPSGFSREQNSTFCALTANELDNISQLNAFFVQYGIDDSLALITQNYPEITRWVEVAKRDPELLKYDNSVDREMVLQDNLYDAYTAYTDNLTV